MNQLDELNYEELFQDFPQTDASYFSTGAHIIIPKLTYYPLDSLILSQNNHKNMIKDIENIDFINLVHLNLDGNHIQNLEAFCRIKMPHLRALNLADNCIITLKSFRKFGISEQLFVVSLEENFIRDPENITEMVHQRIFREIGLDYMNEDINGQDIRWCAKLENKKFFQLCESCINVGVGGSKRIAQKNVVKCCQKFFQNIKFVSAHPNSYI